MARSGISDSTSAQLSNPSNDWRRPSVEQGCHGRHQNPVRPRERTTLLGYQIQRAKTCLRTLTERLYGDTRAFGANPSFERYRMALGERM